MISCTIGDLNFCVGHDRRVLFAVVPCARQSIVYFKRACRDVRSFAVYIFDSAVMIVARTRPSISFAFFSALGVTSTPLVVVVIR